MVPIVLRPSAECGTSLPGAPHKQSVPGRSDCVILTVRGQDASIPSSGDCKYSRKLRTELYIAEGRGNMEGGM